MSNENNGDLSRRSFLKGSAGVAGGLALAFYVPSMGRMALAAGAAEGTSYPPNAFINIAADNSITVIINRLEMGQGVNTSMAQLIAEELECDWKNIKSIASGVAPVYNPPGFPFQITGGSGSLLQSFDQYRLVGASLREMLKTAAATRWAVPVSEVRAENGFIVHPKKGKLSYGDLAVDAGKLPIPEKPSMKSAKDFKIIGQSQKRVDALPKANGTAIFGQDVRIPGMLYANVERPPIADAKLGKIDEAAARAIQGVVDVVRFIDRVAVLATNSYAAKTGVAALKAEWNLGQHAKASTLSMMTEFKKAGLTEGKVARNIGAAAEKMKSAKSTITADYEFPYLAHAPMEPLNVTMNYDGKNVEMWSGFQMPTQDVMMAAKILKLPPEKVKINITYAGGSFGRRGGKDTEYMREACELAAVVKKPFKLVWTREDDIRGGYYRPLTHHRVEVGFDDKNQLLAWDHHIVGQSIMKNTMMAAFGIKDGIESVVVEGVEDTRYKMSDFRCRMTSPDTPMTTLWWRSVGHTHTGYVMETMMDEVAEKSGQDPLAMRRKLLKDSPKHLAVLDLLEKQSGWGKKKAPKGRAWGLAIHESFKSIVGQVAEVSIDKYGRPKVHRVWAAAHVGQVVNPEGARTQIEGAVAFGLSAFLDQRIVIKDGRVVQSNFHDYPAIRMADMPKVSVEFVKSSEHPTGLGEPGVPPIAPAVANALYVLTKKRTRALPYMKGAEKEEV